MSRESPLGLFGCEESFETVEARLPCLLSVFDPTGGFRQTLDFQVARAPLAVAAAGDQPGALLDRQVAVGRQLT